VLFSDQKSNCRRKYGSWWLCSCSNANYWGERVKGPPATVAHPSSARPTTRHRRHPPSAIRHPTSHPTRLAFANTTTTSHHHRSLASYRSCRILPPYTRPSGIMPLGLFVHDQPMTRSATHDYDLDKPSHNRLFSRSEQLGTIDGNSNRLV
jgi:hypothetical protein